MLAVSDITATSLFYPCFCLIWFGIKTIAVVDLLTRCSVH